MVKEKVKKSGSNTLVKKKSNNLVKKKSNNLVKSNRNKTVKKGRTNIVKSNSNKTVKKGQGIVLDPLERIEFLKSSEFENQIKVLEKIQEDYENNNVHKKLNFLYSELESFGKKINKLNKEVEVTSKLKENVEYLSRTLKTLPTEDIKEIDELYSRTGILKNKIREIQHKLNLLDKRVDAKYPITDQPKNIRKDLRADLGLFEDDLMSRFKQFESQIRREFSEVKGNFKNIHGGIKEHRTYISEKSENMDSQLKTLEHRVTQLAHAQNLVESELRKSISKLKKPEVSKLEVPFELLEKIQLIEDRQKNLENQLNLEEVKVLDNEIHEITSKINNLKDALLKNESHIYTLRDDMKGLVNHIEKNIISLNTNRTTIIQ